MRWQREQYMELLTFGEAERPMFVELFGPLIGLEEEWRAQGATEQEVSLEAFAFDYVPVVACGGNTGHNGGYAPQILEETDAYQITRDELGRTMKLHKNVATVPLPLDYPVHDWDSWLRIKPWFEFGEDRIDLKQVALAQAKQRAGHLVTASIPGGFDLPRQLMGEERVCLAYYDQPDLLHDITRTVTDTCLQVCERITDRIVIDNLMVHEDMAGKHACLIGPNTIGEFILPYYRAVWDLVSQRGTRIFSQDSDGNMNAVIPAFLEGGVNVMFPMEPAADMDMVATRKQWGAQLAFKGGIDKHVLRDDKPAILRELEYKLQPLMQQGGVVFGLDHRIPNGTPLENYRFYVDTARDILGLPPCHQDTAGWQRMAF